MTAESEQQNKLRRDLAALRIDRNGPRLPAGNNRKRMAAALAAVVGCVAALWAILGRAPTVTVVQATLPVAGQDGPLPVLSGSGYVVTGDRYVSVGVRVPGRIDHYFVEEGQSVHKGDPLVQIDDREYRATVQRAEAGLALARANLALAESELKRGRELIRLEFISKQDLDILENKVAVGRATVDQLAAELNQARVNLEYTLLRAPTDGVVLAKTKEVGEIAVPGGFAGSGDLIRLANLTDMRAQVDVNEADLNRVRLGQVAEVIPDAYPEARYAAEVVKLYPQVDRQKGTLRVEVRIRQPDNRLLPDMSARITFLAAPTSDKPTAPHVLVPNVALHRDPQGNNFVWVVRDGRALRTIVETAGEVGDQIRITAGLLGGEAVITGDPPGRDGQRVKVAR